MEFNYESENISRVNRFIKMLQNTEYRIQNTEWDTVLLAGNYFRASLLKCREFFLKLYFSFCACAYMVNKSYRLKLIQCIEEAIELLNKTGEQHYAIDSHWNKIMPEDNWFGLYPCLGHQKAVYSNMQKGNINYEALFYKALVSIQQGVYCPGETCCILPCDFQDG